jgi:hypothetical protein
MEQAVDVRALDEWIYAIHTALGDLDPARDAEAIRLLRHTLDDMRERRAHLRLRRHNEVGY